MGLTVVRACLNETIPNPLMMAPATATLTARTSPEGNSNSNAGMAHETSHMSAATRKTSATGGTFNSSTCMAFPRGVQERLDTQASSTDPATNNHGNGDAAYASSAPLANWHDSRDSRLDEIASTGKMIV
jgi:hypothetical protein